MWISEVVGSGIKRLQVRFKICKIRDKRGCIGIGNRWKSLGRRWKKIENGEIRGLKSGRCGDIRRYMNVGCVESRIFANKSGNKKTREKERMSGDERLGARQETGESGMLRQYVEDGRKWDVGIKEKGGSGCGEGKTCKSGKAGERGNILRREKHASRDQETEENGILWDIWRGGGGRR
jgi:hypothetical protein